MYLQYFVFSYNSLRKLFNFSYNFCIEYIYNLLYKKQNFKCYYHNNKKFYINPVVSSNKQKNSNIFLVTLLKNNIECLDYNFTEEFLQLYGPLNNFHNNLISLDEFFNFIQFKKDDNFSYKLQVYDTDFNEYICSNYLNDIFIT